MSTIKNCANKVTAGNCSETFVTFGNLWPLRATATRLSSFNLLGWSTQQTASISRSILQIPERIQKPGHDPTKDTCSKLIYVIYKMFHNVSLSCVSIHTSKSQPSYNLKLSDSYSIFLNKYHEIFNSLQRGKSSSMEPFTMGVPRKSIPR